MIMMIKIINVFLINTVQPPVTKSTLHALFGEIMSVVPVDVAPLIAMCREKSLALFDVYEKTVDEMEKDTIGNGISCFEVIVNGVLILYLEITRIYDVARNTEITFSSFSKPRPAPYSFSSGTPHAYSPIFQKSPVGVRMYSTYAHANTNPLYV
jgi:hypothetical protein